MRHLSVLLGNCEPLLNDYIEALLKELCHERTILECSRASWLEDFEYQARQGRFDLVMLIPQNLRREANQSESKNRTRAVLPVLDAIKPQGSTPVVAFTPADERADSEPLLKAAGADAVLGLPFHAEALKSAVRRVLHLPRKQLRSQPRQWFCPQLPFYQNLEPVFSH